LDVSHDGQTISNSATEAAKTANKTVAGGIDAAKKGLDISYDRGQSIGNNATESTKTSADAASEKASNVASQVQEKLGNALINTGKSIKPENNS